MKSFQLFRDLGVGNWARTALLGATMCAACDQHEKGAPAAPAAPASALPRVEATPAPPVEKLWYEGSWRGQLPMSPDQAIGQLKFEVDASGRVSGQLTTSYGRSTARGQKDDEADVVRVRLVGPEYFGTLICRREGDDLVGTLRASKKGTLDLDSEPPRFGQSWPLRLKSDQ